MLNKYWREYPIFLQLVLFTLMVFTVYYFSFVVFARLVPLYNISDSFDFSNTTAPIPKRLIASLKLRQAVGSCSIFLIPAFLFAYLTTPRPVEYLGFRNSGKKVQWLWVVLGMTGLIPVLIYISTLMHHIDFGKTVAAAQAANDRLVEAMLSMDNLGAFVGVFLLLAVLPAVGEEMMFRGIILKFAAKRRSAFLPVGLGSSTIFPELYDIAIPVKKMIYPLALSGFMFAFMHADLYGLPSIFLAGVALAAIYYLTGSLWCSILGHTLNNGLQIILVYVFRNNKAMEAIANGNSLPVYIPIIGLCIAVLAFSQLWKNRTPLTYGWVEDFTAAEIIEKNTDQ